MNRVITVRDLLWVCVLGLLTNGLLGTATPAGNGSLVCDESTITCATTGVVTLEGTQPNATSYTNFFNVNYNAVGGCMSAATGAPTAEACLVGTSSIGLDVGPINASYSSGTANSQELCVSRLSSSTLANACLQLASGGTLSLNAGGGATTVSTANTNFTAGSGTITTSAALSVGSVKEAAANDFLGSCTMVAAVTCTATVPSFTTPVCVTTDQAHTYGAQCAVSGTTLTVTSGTSNSDVWTFVVGGNPS